MRNNNSKKTFELTLCFATSAILVAGITFLALKNIHLDNRFSREYAKARKDGLTGLKNRLAFEEACSRIEKKQLSDDYTVLSADINDLKAANDNKGHFAGDELISGAADILRSCLSEYGTVYRTGGDEFIALIKCSRKQLQRIMCCLDNRQRIWKGRYNSSISMATGVAVGRNHPGKSMYKLIKEADMNMYNNKKAQFEKR